MQDNRLEAIKAILRNANASQISEMAFAEKQHDKDVISLCGQFAELRCIQARGTQDDLFAFINRRDDNA